MKIYAPSSTYLLVVYTDIHDHALNLPLQEPPSIFIFALQLFFFLSFLFFTEQSSGLGALGYGSHFEKAFFDGVLAFFFIGVLFVFKKYGEEHFSYWRGNVQ